MSSGPVGPILFLLGLFVVLVLLERLLHLVGHALRPGVEKDLIERARNARPDSVAVEASQRSFLKACTNCKVFSLTLPYRDGAGRTYCAVDCLFWGALGATEYCESCLQQTTNQSPGDLGRFNGIGTTLMGSGSRCAQCRSVIRRVWFTLLYLPVFPLKRYRVIQVNPRRFFARRMAA